MNILFASEVLNGNWAILCIVLTFVCSIYLWDEKRNNRGKWTVGMRAAFAVLILTVGIGILRSSEYYSWHKYGMLYHPSMMPLRIIGGAIGAFGFLLAIKEFSRRLYGDLPWAIALVLMIGFTIIEIVIS